MDLDGDDADLLVKLLDTFDQTHTVGDFAFSIRSIMHIDFFPWLLSTEAPSIVWAIDRSLILYDTINSETWIE